MLVHKISPPGGRKVRFRAQVSRSGKKLQIIIPQFYHQDMIDNDFVGKVVQVEVKEVKTGSGDFEDEFGISLGR
jgi:hypothetical protein